MTDLEISRALALAIGWKTVTTSDKVVRVGTGSGWRIFDYKFWTIAGPIAEKFDAFPGKSDRGWDAYSPVLGYFVEADTPQKAIALAMIQGVKK